jgi:(p)ppGpp synthase/HD superfamily hydrolase
MKKGEMLSKAIILATNAHAGQSDKGGVPYILHPLKVMHYLKSSDEELQCIAVLHDVVEDTNTTWQDLVEAGMSLRVIQALMALTKMPGQSYQGYKDAVKACDDAILVKMADLRHNSDIRRLKGISEKDLARIAKYNAFYNELAGLVK